MSFEFTSKMKRTIASSLLYALVSSTQLLIPGISPGASSGDNCPSSSGCDSKNPSSGLDAPIQQQSPQGLLGQGQVQYDTVLFMLLALILTIVKDTRLSMVTATQMRSPWFIMMTMLERPQTVLSQSSAMTTGYIENQSIVKAVTTV